MKTLLALNLLLILSLTSCKHQIDINIIEEKEHGLRYIKGTNTLVNGEVILKAPEGNIVELHNFKEGKMIGSWFQYDDNGTVMSHGFGTEIKNYEDSLNGTDLAYSILSVNEMTDSFAFATIYMDNKEIFTNPNKMIQLSKAIFSDYGLKYKINRILIFDRFHEYSIDKTAVTNSNYSIDTLQKAPIKKVWFH